MSRPPLLRSLKANAFEIQSGGARTVDLSPAAQTVASMRGSPAAAERLGLARVTGQEVLAALVDRLLTDTVLADQITEAIAQGR